jgi:solute carrier family 25 phosphate transporter 3
MAHSVLQKALIGQYATGLVSGLTKIASTEGFSSLYAGFIPILCKQVPYAIGTSP